MIGHKCQWLVNDKNDKENAKCINHDFANDGVNFSARDKHVGPFLIIKVHINGTVRIQPCHMTEHITLGDLCLTLSRGDGTNYWRLLACI